ncbi:hypothetical protein MMC31_002126 [Peltigera leucophlebia]|nr:hypothetical protein [Peltigera leucophlebia]
MQGIVNDKKPSRVDASDDHQARDGTCSEIGGLRTLDDLKCECELGPWRRGTLKSVRNIEAKTLTKPSMEVIVGRTICENKTDRGIMQIQNKEAIEFLCACHGTKVEQSK